MTRPIQYTLPIQYPSSTESPSRSYTHSPLKRVVLDRSSGGGSSGTSQDGINAKARRRWNRRHNTYTPPLVARDVFFVGVPLRTRNPNNGAIGMTKGAAMAKAASRKRERSTLGTVVKLTAMTRKLPPAPWRVTVTRVAPSQGLDPHDGLGAALKGCIDGIADALGLRNDRDERVTWVLEQRRGKPGAYGVEVLIESRVRV